ncbi:MAG: MBL fold metallo-hydrolase RNA specificity domain-containing protein, partial [Promethearchaeota archaeon]
MIESKAYKFYLGLDNYIKGINAFFVSHAHVDHARPAMQFINDASGFEVDNWKLIEHDDATCHDDKSPRVNNASRNLLCSQDTKKIIELLFRKSLDIYHLETPNYPSSFTLNGAHSGLKVDASISNLKFLPSGHCLGSQSLAIPSEIDKHKHSSIAENKNEDMAFLYTGDFSVERGRLLEPLKPGYADILICEATYGLPTFTFPPYTIIRSEIQDWIRETIQDYPIMLYGYPLGKNQEILSLLQPFTKDFKIITDERTHAISELYRSRGISLPETIPYGQMSRKKKFWSNDRWFLLLSMSAINDKRYIRFKNFPCKKAIFSGWTVNEKYISDHDCDVGFKLSGHPSYPELVDFIERVSPRILILTHGNGMF